jgi:type IV fimbrial biogenesis protein FimT
MSKPHAFPEDRAVQRNRGFTLIELMIVVGMVALLVAIASPSFNDATRSNRLDAAVLELKAAINLARSEAVKRSGFVLVEPITSGAWDKGVRVRADANGDLSLTAAADDVIAREYAPLRSVSVTPSAGATQALVFDPNGAHVDLAASPAARVPRETKIALALDSTPRCLTVNKAGMTSVKIGVC